MPIDPLFVAFQQALAGRYSIDRELGRGGAGVVYLAREVHLDRLVAIKLLPPIRAAHPEARDRFLREARLAAKLSHPNVIPIYAVDDAGDFVFFVMAFVDGVTLAERVRTRGPLPASEGARVLREVAWALAHAHAQGLVHRDIKPDNILIESGSGRILVADFGIAAATGDESSDGGIVGTPEFMSPEQALGGAIDARSDLYGLGVTAFYALSGRLPFEGENATAVLAKQVTEAPPSLASLGIAIPRQLILLVERCLAKEPDHRPRSAEAVAEHLGAALELRRELPMALRAFVKRNGRIDGSGTLLYGVALALASTGVSILSTAGWGFATLVAGATAMPLAYLVSAARRLTLFGFAHPDIAPAFTAEIQQAREERAAERNWASERVGKRLGITARISGAIAGLSGAALVGSYVGGDALEALVSSSPLPVIYGISGVIAVASAIGYLTVEQRRRDVDTEFWASVWKGRIGKLAFSLARRLLGNRSIKSAVTHRATELALGMAAEQLFDTLPAASRDALRDLPVVLRRLQADAHALRVRHDEVRDALSNAADADSAPEYTELNAERLAIHGRLGETISAMETIRLNLLRLHAGAASVESLTTHLGLAAEVSADVERLIAAHGEVERALRYPRSITPSPA